MLKLIFYINSKGSVTNIRGSRPLRWENRDAVTIPLFYDILSLLAIN